MPGVPRSAIQVSCPSVTMVPGGEHALPVEIPEEIDEAIAMMSKDGRTSF